MYLEDLSDSARNEIEINSRRIFNYLNGKINIINKSCTLETNWVMKGNTLGYHSYPNYVILYLRNISFIGVNLNHIYVMMTRVLIHELCHADQFIDNGRIVNDVDYNNKIESACDAMTNMLMPTYGLNILNKLGVNTSIYESSIYRMANVYNPRYQLIDYHRKTPADHILQFLVIIINSFSIDLYNDIIRLFRMDDSVFTLVISSRRLVCKYGDYVVEPPEFNSFIEPLYRGRMAHNLIYGFKPNFIDDNNLTLEMFVSISNRLCVIVKED